MSLHKGFYYVALLIISVTFGGMYGLRNKPPLESSSPTFEQKEARFKAEREIKAFNDGSQDFFMALNSKQIDYQKELSRLFEYEVDYGGLDHSKLYLLFSQWGFYSYVDALEAIRDVPSKFKADCRAYVLLGWSQRDPASAAQYYKDNRIDLHQKKLLGMIMSSWAETAPEEAIVFLSSLNVKEEKEGILSVLSRVQFEDPGKYGRIIPLIPERQWNDPGFLDAVALQWVMENPSDAEKWIFSLSSERQELLEKYKDLGSLPPLKDLLTQGNDDPEALADRIRQYPRWIQADAWSIILSDISNRFGGLEMIKWKQEHVPEEFTKEIQESDFFSGTFFMGMEADRPEDYEDVLMQFSGKGTPEDFMNSVYSAYKLKFFTRKPQETLSFLAKRGEGSGYGDVEPLGAWMYDNPDEVQEWLSQLPLPSGEKALLLDKIKSRRPAMAIKKQ